MLKRPAPPAGAGMILEDLEMERRLPEQERPPLWDESMLHLSEEALEAYSLNRIGAEDLLAEMEEHLLVCAHCQRRVEKLDNYHDAVRDALPAVEAKTETGGGPGAWQRVAIAAGVMLLLFVPVAVERLGAPYEAELVATRAEQGNTLPAGRKLALQADRRGLPAGELVWGLFQGEGRKEAEGRLKPDEALVLDELSAGTYWLRLYEPGEEGTPLREFSLVVK
jgi:hypothetical protein